MHILIQVNNPIKIFQTRHCANFCLNTSCEGQPLLLQALGPSNKNVFVVKLLFLTFNFLPLPITHPVSWEIREKTVVFFYVSFRYLKYIIISTQVVFFGYIITKGIKINKQIFPCG